MMKRFENWPTLLAVFIAEARERAFAWGQNDCCLFAADAVRVMTGVDAAAKLRGKYKTKVQAYALLKRFAGGGVAETASKITAAHSMPEVPVLMAQRGDVLLLETELGPALGIVDLSGAQAVAQGIDGLTMTPICAALRAWRV